MAALLLISTMGALLILVTSSESRIAANYRNSVEGLYAADALAERVLGELTAVSDWDLLLNERVTSSFVDGPPDGVRALAGGGSIDLTQAVARANCGKTACTAADIIGNGAADRPWGLDNPVWHLFAYGPLSALLPGLMSPFYVIVLVGDDPSEEDGDPARDGSSAESSGAGIISLRAEAFGPTETHKVIELTVARFGRDGRDGKDGQDGQDGQERRNTQPIRVLSWREVP